ncbi:sensor histidine kinase [Streptomyces sp. NPDC001691]|uniref:sensor histidine kinase n=1 Tax=unclassified Streptomyces TaxID=2593676 RepID=UPI000DEA7D36|nr:HAMP domain-containing sensor histidine kinase [Streptomyces sp. SDr-06]RCH61795.1 sensor histidine kinase [Streptomyces sp. SDr-06]
MIRTRIALIFGGVFLVLGAALLAVVNLLSRAGTEQQATAIATRATTLRMPSGVSAYRSGPAPLEPLTVYRLSADVSDAASSQTALWSTLALVAIALLAVVVGWWTAGRLLRPVHVMTARARRLTASNLHERIGAAGPDDELKELGDTIDDLLGRLEAAFDSQRRFIANASHELRTPLATQRAAIQIGLDGEPGPGDIERTRTTLLDNNRRSEQLIEGLLMLARSERGLERREEVDLAEVVREEAARHDTVKVNAVPAVVRGNRALLARLTANLLANAVTYNVPGGAVEVTVYGGRLVVANPGGPVVAEEDIPALFEPFRRGEGRDRMGPGAGLGLSIVRSIAVAHGGTATAAPGPEGGLTVTVSLPKAAAATGGTS